mmetsp:Transcript_41834/g.100842  ORF Transcript_41834/g.100842 Transcript_41834/m.100842 type:complete len:336 (+) Transcript_41834:153-1160(+)
MSSQQQQRQVSGCIVVVAKCPIPGKSKTRLIPLLGKDGSSKLAKAMLSDVLLTLEHCPELKNVNKVLLYAPGDETGLSIMTSILDEIRIEGCIGTEGECSSGTSRRCWRLLPMISPNLQSSDLGDILQHALDRVVKAPWNQNQEEQNTISTGVVFLGMDSPEIALPDIVKGLQLALMVVDKDGEHEASESRLPALLCPSDDGGYGMLCVPSTSVSKGIFQNVYWSHPLTAVSQLKALTDASIPVVLGQLMHDIDEPEDVTKLCQRLSSRAKIGTENKIAAAAKPMGLDICSSYESSGGGGRSAEDSKVAQVQSTHPECKYTKLALKELDMLDTKD